MTFFILFVAMFAIASAQFTFGINENDYLLVCQAGSKKAQTKVQEILATSTDHMQQLEEAIDRDDTETILNVVKNVKRTFTETIAAIQGTVYAAIQDAVSGGFVGEKKRCLTRCQGELVMHLNQAKGVAVVTKQAATEFKRDTSNDVFYQYYRDLNELMIQVAQFLGDASQIQRLKRACLAANVDQLMNNVVFSLKTLRPKLINEGESTKKYAVESSTGILIDAVTLNAICHAGQYVNEADSVQQQVMRQDSKKAQNLVNDLEAISKDILGQNSWFLLLSGY